MTNPPTKLTKHANNNPPIEYKHNSILVKKALIEYMYNIYRTEDEEQKGRCLLSEGTIREREKEREGQHCEKR